MALADYYDRGALAAAQALQGGFEDSRFRSLLKATPLGISFEKAAGATPEGQALLDLTVRIAARLFPAIQLDPDEGAGGTDGAAELARAINPNIELVEDSAQIGVALGGANRTYERTVHAGSDGWNALISTEAQQRIGSSQLPFGAGAAACLAMAEVFRWIFLAAEHEPQPELRYSTFKLGAGDSAPASKKLTDIGQTALIGAGAIGNAAVWALARAPIEGTLQIVNPEMIELQQPATLRARYPRRRGCAEGVARQRTAHRRPYRRRPPRRVGGVPLRAGLSMGADAACARQRARPAFRAGVATALDRQCLDPARRPRGVRAPVV